MRPANYLVCATSGSGWVNKTRKLKRLRHGFPQFHSFQIAIIQFQQRGRIMKLVIAKLALFLFLVCILSAAFAQNSNQPPAQTSNEPAPIPLWANGAPGSKGGAP